MADTKIVIKKASDKNQSKISGSVYFDEKRKRYVAEIRWVDNLGKHQRKRSFHKTKSAAKDELEDYRRKVYLENGGGLDSDDIIFREYADFWLRRVIKPNKKIASANRIETTLVHQVFPYIGDIPVNKIKPQHIKNMLSMLSEKGYSHSTIKKAFDAVNACLREYRMDRGMSFNPCENITVPSAQQKDISDIVYFNEKEQKKIVETATKTFSNGAPVYRFGWAIVALMFTGMRVGELLALTWRDIDFSGKTIRIDKNSITVKKEGHYITIDQKSTKTKKGNRVIPLTEYAKKAFEKIRELNGKHNYVMTSKNGKRVTVSNIDRMFKRVLINSGVVTEEQMKNDNNRYGVHSLRHTFASMLFKNGSEVKVVSEILGHSSTKITEDIYIHLIQEQKAKAIKNIDKYVSGSIKID